MQPTKCFGRFQYIRLWMDLSLTIHLHQAHPIALLPDITALKNELTTVTVCVWQFLQPSTMRIPLPGGLTELKIWFQSLLVLILHYWYRQQPQNNPTSPTTAKAFKSVSNSVTPPSTNRPWRRLWSSFWRLGQYWQVQFCFSDGRLTNVLEDNYE